MKCFSCVVDPGVMVIQHLKRLKWSQKSERSKVPPYSLSGVKKDQDPKWN